MKVSPRTADLQIADGTFQLAQQFHRMFSNKLTHAIVDSPACQDDFGMVSHGFGFSRQVIGIDADTMPSHQSRTKFQEIPFCPGRFQDGFRVDAQAMKDERQFVH